MIDPVWCRTMAAYNSEMNRRIYDAADKVSDDERRQSMGAFFGSIHGTLNHVLWADHMWMHRFDGWEKPPVSIPGSPDFIDSWAALQSARALTDHRIADWAEDVSEQALGEDFTWFSGATQREMRRPLWLLVTHMFNHQTHHRGQAHALLTRLGVRTADTDLPWVVSIAALGL